MTNWIDPDQSYDPFAPIYRCFTEEFDIESAIGQTPGLRDPLCSATEFVDASLARISVPGIARCPFRVAVRRPINEHFAAIADMK
jgi:hypothetical protein